MCAFHRFNVSKSKVILVAVAAVTTFAVFIQSESDVESSSSEPTDQLLLSLSSVSAVDPSRLRDDVIVLIFQ
jgi:hypothetical protein